MSTKIRLMRMGKIRTPYFRIVVTDSRKARNGLSIEEIGRYAPGQEPSLIEVNSDRALYWLGTGAGCIHFYGFSFFGWPGHWCRPARRPPFDSAG